MQIGYDCTISWKSRDKKADEVLIQLSLLVKEPLKLLHEPDLEYDRYDLPNQKVTIVLEIFCHVFSTVTLWKLNIPCDRL